MNTYFPNATGRSEISALLTVVAILFAATLTKLGLETWTMAAMLALCLLAAVRIYDVIAAPFENV